jgi:hypothetical protein
MTAFSISTSKAPYFKNSAGNVYYVGEDYVQLAWSTAKISLADTQVFYEQVLTLMRQNGARKILSEHGQRQPLSPAVQHWIIHNWIPRAMQQAQVAYCAIVDGSNPMHRLSTQTVIFEAPEGFTFKRFSTIIEAQTWLRSLPA